MIKTTRTKINDDKQQTSILKLKRVIVIPGSKISAVTFS